MDLSIVIVHYRDPERLGALLRTLPAALAGLTAETIIVDNGADAPAFAQQIRAILPGARILSNAKNRGFAAGVNQGVKASTQSWVAILNPDVELQSDFFPPQLRLLRERPEIAVVGPSVFRSDGRRQLTAHRRFPSLWTEFVEYCLPLQVGLSRWLPFLHPHDESPSAHRRTHRTHHITGVCLVVRREEFLASGGFDEQFFLYMEETDWQQRLSPQGREVWYCADARCTHFGSIDKRFAQGTPFFLRSLFRYWRKRFGPARVWSLRLTIGLAWLMSFLFLIPLGAAAVFYRRLRRKARLYFSGYFTILLWLFRSDPTA